MGFSPIALPNHTKINKMIREKEIIKQSILDVARLMTLAARTAPKARGVNTIEIAVLDEKDIALLSGEMERIASTMSNTHLFLRDAQNILNASYVFLIGTRIQSLGLELCGLCGYKNCEEKNKYPDNPCSFNTGDLGIALGAAVSVASMHHIDNRIMYTVGMAAKSLKFLSADIKIIYGVPLAASSKNPFFDRK